jgi:SAM-dependent methyltransferase
MATALDAAWAAFSADADDHESKVLLSWLLLWTPQHVRPEHETALLSLAQDPRIDPDSVSRAGWTLVLGRAHGGAEDDESAARFLERDELAGVLLRESPVLHEDAELRLTAVRRWLLRNRAWARFPRLADDLIEQARLNGGAWGWEADERALLDRPESRPLIPAYWPRGAPQAGGACADDVARAVAAQYERWPYPRWRRVTVRGPMAPLDGPDERAPLRAGARILVAGCGTGGEAAMVAMNNPGAEVVGIDVSHASLRYAEERRAALGAGNLRFVHLDLHSCADLGVRFDEIRCSGVLHHLPDPEAGWGALAGVLRPGGAMRIAVYSRIARLAVAAARRAFADLAQASLDDDMVRRVRQRLLSLPQASVARSVTRSPDFATLEGALDLLLHRHEDAFDIPRIGRAIEALRLRLRNFLLPTPSVQARYDAQFPDDPGHRRLDHWARFERLQPHTFGGMYAFWCEKPDL